MIIVKNTYNNGLFEVEEIYHETNKILETTNNVLWNATEDNPICIAKSRHNDYVVSDELLDVEEANEQEVDSSN